MVRNTTALIMIVAACVALTGAGCNDEVKSLKAHIALIEDTNQRLTDELAGSMRQVDDLARERETLNGQVLAAGNEADDLRRRLAEMPTATATPQQATPVPDGWRAVPGGAKFTIEAGALFARGRKAALRDGGRSTLDVVVSAINAHFNDKDIIVLGHTDDEPIKLSGWKDNYELSTQRALSVVRYLKDRGVDPKRLVASGCGEYQPLVPSSGEAGRIRNRRVEIFAVEPW